MLVSTTIIESGLDIPQANTLVVERADALGLAQLYQIRGRVGRSDVLAHAYLFYPDGQELTPEARARLATLADHTELGSGFAIAMRDLEIRGAGNLLGAEQSGHVAAIGPSSTSSCSEAAPSSAAPAVRSRVRLRRRPGGRLCPDRLHARRGAEDRPAPTPALAESEDEEPALPPKTGFGPLPEPVESLFAIQEVKLKLARSAPTTSSFAAACSGRPPRARLRRAASRCSTAPIAVYSSAKRELTQRGERFPEAVALVDAILDLRLSA